LQRVQEVGTERGIIHELKLRVGSFRGCHRRSTNGYHSRPIATGSIFPELGRREEARARAESAIFERIPIVLDSTIRLAARAHPAGDRHCQM
jgi:hypothetical protein